MCIAGPAPPLHNHEVRQPLLGKGDVLLWLAVATLAAGLGGTAALAVGVATWARAPEGQDTLSGVRQVLQVVVTGASARGTRELKEVGCSQAAVLDASRVSTLLEQAPRLLGDRRGGSRTADQGMVMCLVQEKRRPTCDQVARTYARAVGEADGAFVAMVRDQSLGGGEVRCAAVYDASGKLLTRLEVTAE